MLFYQKYYGFCGETIFLELTILLTIICYCGFNTNKPQNMMTIVKKIYWVKSWNTSEEKHLCIKIEVSDILNPQQYNII